ncbi:6865_t:CDS:1, partial [Ambispora leptoticha]
REETPHQTHEVTIKREESTYEMNEIAGSSLFNRNIHVIKREDETHEITIKREESIHETNETTGSSSFSRNIRMNKKKKTRYEINKESSLFARNIRANKREEAHKCLKEGRLLKALNLYEEVLRSSRHAA